MYTMSSENLSGGLISAARSATLTSLAPHRPQASPIRRVRMPAISTDPLGFSDGDVVDALGILACLCSRPRIGGAAGARRTAVRGIPKPFATRMPAHFGPAFHGKVSRHVA